MFRGLSRLNRFLFCISEQFLVFFVSPPEKMTDLFLLLFLFLFLSLSLPSKQAADETDNFPSQMRASTKVGRNSSADDLRKSTYWNPQKNSTGAPAFFDPSNEKLYEAYSQLHTLAQEFDKPFDSPAVLVVGHQTDGKSALVEALMGFQFNHVGVGRKHDDRLPSI